MKAKVTMNKRITSEQVNFSLSSLEEEQVKVGLDWQGQYEGWLRGKKAVKTAEAYLLDLGVFARWFEAANGQGFEPGLLNSWDLRNFREWSLGTQRVSAATWNRRRASLLALIGWAREMGVISNNPMADVGVEGKQEQGPRWLTKGEFGKVMRQLELEVNGANTGQRKGRAIRDAAMVSLMAYGGLRESEVCNLLGQDVELGERSGWVLIRRGKGGKERRVPLSRDARVWLGAWLETGNPTETIFEGIKPRAIQKRVAGLGEAAGVQDLYPHRLRHTCAKRMVDAGVPLTVVQQIMGHSRLDTTAVYTQAGWEDLVAGVESVALGGMRRN
jgi:integrase/recombinase XerC